MNLSVKEKIYGAVFGYAIGDALGLGTELMTKAEAQKRYPNGLTDYRQIVRDAHRSQWKRGGWTNDTEIVLILLDSIARCGNFNYLDMAAKLKEWYNSEPTDLTRNLRLVFKQENYAEHPFEAAEEAWDKLGIFEYSSECVGRAIFSFLSYYPLQTARDLCRLTHPKMRCVSSCKAVAAMADSLFKTGETASYDDLVKAVQEKNEDVIGYLHTAYHGAIEDFDLDDHETSWFVRKTMGSSLWAIWHASSFEDGLYTVINEAGDADTNASSSAALLGLKFGFSSIPTHLVDGLINNERLFSIADRIITFIESQKIAAQAAG